MKKHDVLTVAALFLLAVVVAGLFWAVLPAAYRENQSTDYTAHYEPVARAILAGRGIRDETGALATRYPPGFPLLLAGTWAAGRAAGVADETALLAFRLLCAGLSVVLLYALARLVWPWPAAAAVGVVWAGYPFFLWLTKQPNSEVPFIPVFFAALFVFWLAVLRRPRAWALYLLAGLLAGAAMLIRPSALGLGVALAALALWLSARLAVRGVDRRTCVALGGVLGLGLLTKLTVVAGAAAAGIPARSTPARCRPTGRADFRRDPPRRAHAVTRPSARASSSSSAIDSSIPAARTSRSGTEARSPEMPKTTSPS